MRSVSIPAPGLACSVLMVKVDPSLVLTGGEPSDTLLEVVEHHGEVARVRPVGSRRRPAAQSTPTGRGSAPRSVRVRLLREHDDRIACTRSRMRGLWSGGPADVDCLRWLAFIRYLRTALLRGDRCSLGTHFFRTPAHAASQNATRRAALPFRARPLRRFPAYSWLPGDSPVHEARCAAAGTGSCRHRSQR